MTKTYNKKNNGIGWNYIELLDSEKPNSVTVIPIDPANTDYQAYLKWVSEGNIAEQAD